MAEYTAKLINLSTQIDGTAYKEIVSRTEIFVDEKSVARTEFYMAMNAGVKPTYILETRVENYALGEQTIDGEIFQADKIEYAGQIYDIIRSYAVDTTKVQLTIGGINRNVKIQSKSASVDSFGQPIDTWTDLIDCLATIESVSGREFIGGQAIQSEVTQIVTVKYRSWIKPNMRVLYGTRIFQVMYMIVNEENLDLKLQCKELFIDA
jgi:SPP1 family predicted phage head-tail adaptor